VHASCSADRSNVEPDENTFRVRQVVQADCSLEEMAAISMEAADLSAVIIA
jgi:hypothetical protein